MDNGLSRSLRGLGQKVTSRIWRLGYASRFFLAILLGSGTELEDGRGEQEDAVLGDPLRRTCPVVLLLEDQPLPQRGVTPPVRLRPAHHRPAVGEELSLPVEMAGEPLAGVTRRQRRRRDDARA